MWRYRVSIPVPRACKARALPTELYPHKNNIRTVRAPRIELGTYCVLGSRHNQLDQARAKIIYSIMPEVGFEPTHPKITELKSAALDRSAIQAHNI